MMPALAAATDAAVPTILPLGAFELVLAAGLVLLAGLVSVLLRLGLERRLTIAALRTVLQLLLIGYILRYVFELDSIWLLAIVVMVMLAVAAHAAARRTEAYFDGMMTASLIALVASSLLTTWMVTRLIIGVEPWYQPQYMVPLLGMILGNSLTGISLCLDQLLTTLKDRRHEIEMELALGATRWEAARRPLREAVRRGMIPTINAMSVVGIVSLPGMMTGQILAGADPLLAVKYQIVVMFMIAAATALGCIFIGLLVYARLFNARHQLRAERIQTRQF
ncbi:MAG: iron export ABC transporter permease subunit FetB [Phycisphaeraceae bacterium]|nr:iron export ABC transporter permease subunit FetB [Phycisphaeraceae bacterium]